MMKTRLLCLWICTCQIVSTVAAREWRDSTGKFSTNAEFHDLRGTTLYLLKDNGKIIAVPMTRLNAEDKQEAITQGLANILAADWALRVPVLGESQEAKWENTDEIGLLLACQGGPLEMQLARRIALCFPTDSRFMELTLAAMTARTTSPTKEAMSDLFKLQTQIILGVAEGAEARKNGPDWQLARSKICLHFSEAMVKDKFLGSPLVLTLEDGRLAADFVETESIINEWMTPTLADALAKLRINVFGNRSEQLWKAIEPLEVHANDALAASRLADLSAGMCALRNAKTERLTASRKHARDLLHAAVLKNPQLAREFVAYIAFADESATIQTKESRKVLWTAIAGLDDPAQSVIPPPEISASLPGTDNNPAKAKTQSAGDTSDESRALEGAPKPVDHGANAPTPGDSRPKPREVQRNQQLSVEAVADEIATFEEISTWAKNDGKNSFSEFLFERIATYEEPLEQRIARAMLLAHGGLRANTELEKSRLELAQVKRSFNLVTFVSLTKDSKIADAYIKIADKRRSAEPGANRATHDQLEVSYNTYLDPADVVRAIDLVNSETTQELVDARTQLRRSLCDELAKQPDVLKRLRQPAGLSPEVRDSRDRSRARIEDARKKK